MKIGEISRLREAVLVDYGSFVEAMFYYLNNGQPMLKAEHHIQITTAITEMMFKEAYDNNLLINIAPRSGKTMLAVVYLIPYLFALSKGRAEVLVAGYSTTLSKASIRDAVAIMQSPVYQMLFPYAKVARFVDGRLETEKGGVVNPVSPMSSLTGLGAGSRANGYGYQGIIIIDDLLNSADSFSGTVRKRANTWYTDSLLSRKNDPKTPIICIAQRIHEDDLPAHILETEGDLFKKVIVPTINEKDKLSFWEDKYPYEKMMEMKEKNPFIYNTQYQQSPTSKGAGIFKPEMFIYYDYSELPDYSIDDVFITADTAFTVSRTADYSVFQVWVSVGHGEDKHIYLLDQVRGKFESVELLERAKEIKDKYDCGNFYIEHAASGIGLIQQLKGVYGSGDIIEVKRGAKENKTSRAFEASLYMAQGKVHLPRHADFTKELVEELLSFSEMMSHRHDDQVDALADAIHMCLVLDAASAMGDWTGYLGL